MGLTFWIKRFVLVMTLAFVVIVHGQLLQRRALARSLIEAAIWAPITATVFTSARLYQSRKGIKCAMCNDIPEPAQSDANLKSS